MKKITTLLLTLVLAMVATASFAQEEPNVVKLGSAVTELEVGQQYVLQSVVTGGYIYPKAGAVENATLWSNDGTMKGMTEEEVAPYVITLEEVDADNLIFFIKNVSSELYVSLSGNNASEGYSCLVGSADEDGCIVQFEPIDGTDNTFAIVINDGSGKALYTDDTYESACQAMAPQGEATVHSLPAFQYKLYLLNLVPESELGPFPWEFINTQWVTSDVGRLLSENITYNDDNTITVKALENGFDEDGNPLYTNNAALSNSAATGITTEDFYTTLDQQWLVIVGKDLSTAMGDSYLWWLNGINVGSSVPQTYTVELEDGQVLFAWDVTKTGLDANLKADKNTQDGWTCFGLTPTTDDGTATFSDISFYSWEEAVAKYPELANIDVTPEDAEPYVFVNTDWTTSDFGRLLEENITWNDDNTITAKATVAGYADDGSPIYTNNIGLGNSFGRAQFSEISTENYYTTIDQNWFVVVGTDLSLDANDSYLWWLNGGNNGSQYPATYSVTLEDGRVLVTWDITHSGFDTRMQDNVNVLDGWTCFGVTPTTENGTSTLSDISFYSWKEAATKYPELEAVGGGADGPVPYEFVNTQWVTTDLGRLSQDQISYDENENSIAVDVEGQNNVALGNSNQRAQYSGITTIGYYATLEQHWLVVKGELLSVALEDSYLWWLNGANNNTQVMPTVVVRNDDDGTVVFAWDLNESGIDDNMQEEENTLNGWTAFGLTTLYGSTVIYDISFCSWEEAVAKYPELEELDNIQALLETHAADVEAANELAEVFDEEIYEHEVNGDVDQKTLEEMYDALENLLDAIADYSDIYANDDSIDYIKEAIEALENAYNIANSLTDAITDITIAASEGQAIYTLSGVRVSKAVKGVYIVDGKKVLVK